MTAMLTEVKILNFRSCKQTDVLLSNYVALVGYNNSGKSNILSAIQWLLKKFSLEVDDFYDDTKAVEVVGVLKGISENVLNLLTEDNRKKIEPYVHEEGISIKRVQPHPEAKMTEIVFYVRDIQEDKWVKNPGGIDAAIAALFPDPIRIGAMENAVEDVAKSKASSTIGKLLAQFVGPLRAAHAEEANKYLFEIERRLSADGQSRFPELGEIDKCINEKINDLFPGVKLKLDFPSPTFDDIIKSGTVKVYEGEGVGRNFASYGHGTQRSIQMALVRHLADIKQTEVNGNTTLLLIDEPELYLHPFAIENIREALKKLSAAGYQVIFSTHSAQMISSKDAQNAVLVRKGEADGVTTCRRRLADVVEQAISNGPHQSHHLFSLTNSSQFLFAESVVLAEGKTEQRLLPALFFMEKSKTLGQCNMALIPLDGADSVKKTLDILRAMGVPAKAILDLDYAFKGAIQQGYILENDPDVVAMKAEINRISLVHGFKIDQNGLPTKKESRYTAAEAYEFIAADSIAAEIIDRVHDRMRQQGIWIWKKGAIEKPLGLRSKKESEWSQFVGRCEQEGHQSICADYPEVKRLIDWICEAAIEP